MPLLAPELSLAVLETLFAEGPIGLAFLDCELRYVRVSERYAQFTGLSPDAHVGRTLPEIVPALADEAIERMRESLSAGVAGEGELEGETPAHPGVRRSWHCSWYPVREDGAIVGLASLALETTDESRAAEQRGRLFALEQRARERAQEAEQRAAFLAEATTLLDSSLDLPTTLKTLSGLVVPMLADLCLIDMLDQAGDARRVAVTHPDPGVEQRVWELTRRWPSAPGTEVGIRRVLESGEAAVIEDVTEPLLTAAFPDPEHREHVRALDLHAAVILPLRARGRKLGAITFVRTGTREAFGPADVSLAADLAKRASLAVDNARLHTELRRAGRDQRFLAEAGRLLADSLDLTTTAETVARLATGGIADGCAVEVLTPAEELRTVAVAHVDPVKREAIGQMRRRWPARGRISTVARALATGRSQLVRELAAERTDHLDPDQVAWLAGLGLRSLIVVPLVARGRTLGALLLAVTESERCFTDGDLALAEELARRAAVAADNSRLYSERSRVARTLQRSLVPAALPAPPGLEVAARFRAAGDGGEIGGDFYDVWEIGDGRWAAVVGDVCGKGAEAAALTALARHTVRAASHYERGRPGCWPAWTGRSRSRRRTGSSARRRTCGSSREMVASSSATRAAGTCRRSSSGSTGGWRRSRRGARCSGSGRLRS